MASPSSHQDAKAQDAAQLERARALVNPASGLANDYLNIYNEIVMLIEHLPQMPFLIDDIHRWSPLTYEEYFNSSILPGRGAVLEIYANLSLQVRLEFGARVTHVCHAATQSIELVQTSLSAAKNTPEQFEQLCLQESQKIRRVLLKASYLVNHGLDTKQNQAAA